MILNSVMRAGVGHFEGLELLTAKERHFGKMMIFCTLAMIQGLIVAIGNIALLGHICHRRADVHHAIGVFIACFLHY